VSCGAPAFAATSASVVAAAAAAQFLIHTYRVRALSDKGMKEIDSFCNAVAAFSINAWNNARCRFWSIHEFVSKMLQKSARRERYFIYR
jgi:hypothetical protein